MEKEKPIIVTENTANYFWLKRYRMIFWPIYFGLAGGVSSIVILYILFILPTDFMGNIVFFSLIILSLFYLDLIYRRLDHGIRPLKLYKNGIEIPQVVMSWKVPEMKKNNTLPTEFLPYSQIYKIETWFNKKGNLDRQFVITKINWKGHKKEVAKIEMHPPLAKEVMNALKEIVGTQQLADWLEKGGMRFLSESPACREQANMTWQEILDDEVRDELYHRGCLLG
ncbi:MAG TPA: hypothetical protein EYP29_05040 [Thermoplasmata archaeon]|nr:hypothetical protein [Thermoplasmata archaeon]